MRASSRPRPTMVGLRGSERRMDSPLDSLPFSGTCGAIALGVFAVRAARCIFMSEAACSERRES